MKTSGISGNEMYCLNKLALKPGQVAVGNSVFSLGMVGSFISGVKNFVGGEVSQISSFIQEGRHLAIQRLENEAKNLGEIGITDVSTKLIHHQETSNIEFLSIGSGLYKQVSEDQSFFSSSCDGTELYCNIDANYIPKKFVFGNVAYAIGAVGGIMGALRTLKRGEVKEYSQILNHTRHLALDRIIEDAKASGANAVLNIETEIVSYMPGVTEMLMIGTSSLNSHLPEEYLNSPVTSDLTSTELWSITKMGYIPMKLVLGTSVYSLGVVGGITSAFKSIFRGEISELTTLVYEARENAISLISKEAEQIGADDVIGVKTYMYELGGGMIEFMAIGTAVKKIEGVKTVSEELIPQAIISDKATFFNSTRYEALGGLMG